MVDVLDWSIKNNQNGSLLWLVSCVVEALSLSLLRPLERDIVCLGKRMVPTLIGGLSLTTAGAV